PDDLGGWGPRVVGVGVVLRSESPLNTGIAGIGRNWNMELHASMVRMEECAPQRLRTSRCQGKTAGSHSQHLAQTRRGSHRQAFRIPVPGLLNEEAGHLFLEPDVGVYVRLSQVHPWHGRVRETRAPVRSGRLRHRAHSSWARNRPVMYTVDSANPARAATSV